MNPLTDQTTVAVAGDWHGNTQWAVTALKALRAEGIKTVYHVGDFGFWPGREGEKFLRYVEKHLAIYDITIYVTPGNHEDYAQLTSQPVSDDGLQWFTPHIAAMPRGFRWESGGTSFVSLGGAPSINFDDLKSGISWWPEEALTLGDLYRLSGEGHADIMITHDAPDGVSTLDKLMAYNDAEFARRGESFSEEGKQYAAEGRKLMTHAVKIVQPDMLFHGHYHHDYMEVVDFKDEGVFSTRIVGLNMDRRHNNICLLNTETKAVEWFPLEPLH